MYLHIVYISFGAIHSAEVNVSDPVAKIVPLKRRKALVQLHLLIVFQLRKAKLDEDLFVLRQFHALDQAHQQLPVGRNLLQEPLHQLFGSVLLLDGAFCPRESSSRFSSKSVRSSFARS